jgi:hypothetical protein
VGKARTLPKSGSSNGCFSKVLTNIRQGWKALSGTDILAFYRYSLITSIKSFTTLDPRIRLLRPSTPTRTPSTLWPTLIPMIGILSAQIQPPVSLASHSTRIILLGQATRDQSYKHICSVTDALLE